MATNLKLNLLEQLIDSLQACFSTQEAYTTIAPLMQQLFPDEAGAIYVVNPSKTLLKAIAIWGPQPMTSDPIFTPDECFALRRKKTHLVEDTHYGLLCQHIRPNSLAIESCCVPMTVHGEPLGVLYVSSSHRGRMSETEQLANSVAKQIGLALANLRLRETMNNQSFRDPLTKLYNRRYLEESLEREIRCCEHQSQPLGIILFNIDQFAEFTTTFGHRLGDVLLREISLLLPNQIRASDIACRYRGDEFLLLLPKMSLAAIQDQAERLRQAVQDLSIVYKGQTFDSLTISCGIASFPEHGITGKALIQAANAALNCAK
jgi:diguanylate cyclase (GGDEF)-like protein